MKIELSINSQSVETSGITKDYREAICEYIWNGFEANATKVMVDFVYNEIYGITEVIISDNGDGIKYETISDTFGTFLASQKNILSLQLKSKANKGKGRFSCFSFASNAQWTTTVLSSKEYVTYSISINSVNKTECEISEPVRTYGSKGTVLKITGIDTLKVSDVSFDALEESMLKAFAWYFYLNMSKKLSLSINGHEFDYTKYIDTENSITKTIDVEAENFTIALIVWAKKIKESYCSYYLDATGSLCGK
ncbi:MAG: ATP-binding protein [Anaerotignaceae bacterium]